MNPSPGPRWAPSVTVAAIVEREGRFLIVEEQTPEGLRLNNPAGHLEPGETLIEAVARETLEETACALEPTALLGIYQARFRRPASDEDVTYLRFAFCGDLGAMDPNRPLDQGIVRLHWLSRAEVFACRHWHRSPLVMRCIDDYLTGRRLPLDALHHDPSIGSPWEFGVR
jgi:8-oxo-dGTP pyrophosphatase MutT (NUDIX family)